MQKLSSLYLSEDPRIRALALRLLEQIEKPAAKSLIERGLKDEDVVGGHSRGARNVPSLDPAECRVN